MKEHFEFQLFKIYLHRVMICQLNEAYKIMDKGFVQRIIHSHEVRLYQCYDVNGINLYWQNLLNLIRLLLSA